MNPHYRHSDDPRTPKGYQNSRNRAKKGNSFEGASGRYRSKAEIDMIFERLIIKERERTTSERQLKTQWAQVEAEAFRQELRHTKRESGLKPDVQDRRRRFTAAEFGYLSQG
jgi:hypothetical protein